MNRNPSAGSDQPERVQCKAVDDVRPLATLRGKHVLI